MSDIYDGSLTDEIDAIWHNEKWISFKDRLPEQWKRVLLLSHTGRIEIGARCISGWGLDKNYISDHNHSGYESTYPLSSYPYWMCLPEPPK